jgi:hypothetical protein
LGHPQPGRGPGEIQQLRHRHEVSQVPQFHGSIIPERYRNARNKVLAGFPPLSQS